MSALYSKKKILAVAGGLALLIGVASQTSFAHDAPCPPMPSAGIGQPGMMPPPTSMPGMMPGMGGPGMMGHGPVGMPLKALNLTGEQEDKVFAIIHAQGPKFHENQKIIRENFKALRELKGKTFDQAKVDSLTQSIGRAMAANISLREQSEAEIYQLLNADQRKKLETIQKQMKEKRENMGFDGPGPR